MKRSASSGYGTADIGQPIAEPSRFKGTMPGLVQVRLSTARRNLAFEGKIHRCLRYGTTADRDGPWWLRKLPPFGSDAPLIPLVGASDCIAGQQFILLRSTA